MSKEDKIIGILEDVQKDLGGVKKEMVEIEGRLNQKIDALDSKIDLVKTELIQKIEDSKIEMIDLMGEIAVQSTQQIIDSENKLSARMDKIEIKIDGLDEKIDDIGADVKKIDHNHYFVSEKVRRHDFEISQLQRRF